MNKGTRRLLMITSILHYGLMIGCGNDARPPIVEEESPGQFRQMAIDAAAGEQDMTEQ